MSISRKEALELLRAEKGDLEDLISWAKRVRRTYYGDSVRLCAIVNAKSGRCPEKCAFCSQSRHYRTGAPVYPLKTVEELLSVAQRAFEAGASEFSIVTSGRSIRSKKEIDTICRTLSAIRNQLPLVRCASLGEVGKDNLEKLRDSGLQCFHHNIETAPSFHPKIVKTHSFADEVRVIADAKAVGLAVCCGGIFGMGESDEQRVELLFALRDIDPDFIPINFLNPIPGTPLENVERLTPLDCLRIIAVTRLVLPEKHIVVCGGREVNLGEWQWRMFDAGATGTMVGDYLTTKGQSPEEDMAMIRRAGYTTVRSNEPVWNQRGANATLDMWRWLSKSRSKILQKVEKV